VKCRLCESGDLRFRANGSGFRVWECRVCGAGNADTDGRAAVDDYAASYDHDFTSAKAQRCWTLTTAAVPGPVRGARLLDVGCGIGDYLDLAQRAGMVTTGVEVAETAARLASERHDVVVGSIEAVDLTDRPPFDLVTMWDVLEHLDRPRDILRTILSVLKPGGCVLVATPLMGSVFDRAGIALNRVTRGRMPQLLDMCWSEEHLTRFSPEGLLTQLSEIGYTDVDARRELLLSLHPDRYAGGAVMRPWTRSNRVNATISRAGVAFVRSSGIRNKVVVRASRA
jgi:2-polyprenyl-3-methyl-5-hydroxy-6-metoxy-1,4-benzoquinol methylase